MTKPRKQSAARWSLPTVIDPVDKRCVMILVPDEPYHIAAFRGALAHLAHAHKWAEDVDHTAREVAWVWQGIIDSMEWGCGVPETECRDFPPYAGFIEWHPTNPFIEPNEVPSGYIFPPFQIVTEDNLLQFVGYNIGDVLTDLTRFYGGTGVITDPESGFARFRLNLTGVGRVQLYLLAFPLGGFALVTTDDNPLSAVFVDTEMDLTSAPIETNEEIINEIIFETDGEHHIDVTFIPKINDAIDFIGYGGGLRKVKLCGFDEMEEIAVFDIRQDPTRPCIVQKRADEGAAWVDAVNMQLCPPKIRVNNGVVEWQDGDGVWHPVEDGDEREDGTYTPPWPSVPEGQDAACLTAANITSIYSTGLSQVRANLEAELPVIVTTAAVMGVASLFMPAALLANIILSFVAAGYALGIAGIDEMLDADSLNHFRCSIACNIESDGTVTGADFTALRADMSSWADVVELAIIQTWLDGFGSVGLTRQGNAAGIVSANCDDCDCDEPPERIFNCHLWVSPDDTPQVFTPLWGGSLSNTANGTDIGINHFSSEDVGGGAQGMVVVSAVLPAPISTYGSTISVYVKKTQDTAAGIAMDMYKWNGTEWGAQTAFAYSNAPFDEEVLMAAISTSGMTATTRLVFYAYILANVTFEITRIEIDDVQAL